MIVFIHLPPLPLGEGFSQLEADETPKLIFEQILLWSDFTYHIELVTSRAYKYIVVMLYFFVLQNVKTEPSLDEARSPFTDISIMDEETSEKVCHWIQYTG